MKKWLSSLSAAQESPKTRPKHYENVVLGPRTGDTRERAKGVFNRLAVCAKFGLASAQLG